MQVNLAEAKNILPSLISAMEQGEEIILACDGVPVAKVVHYQAPKVKPLGAWKGKAEYSKDFNTPETNLEIERLFYDSDSCAP